MQPSGRVWRRECTKRRHDREVWMSMLKTLNFLAGMLVVHACVLGAQLKEGQKFEIDGKTALASKIDDLPVVENQFSKRFHWDSFDNPKLKELREKYHLDEVIAPGKDEFEKQLLL